MPSNLTSISFPASPALNDTYTYGNQTYQWNGTEWVVSYDSNSIPIGAVTLSGNQTITGVKTFSNNIIANSQLLIGSSTIIPNPTIPFGYKLEITVENSNNSFGIYSFGASDANVVRLYGAQGTKASPTAAIADQTLGGLRGFGYNGSAWTPSNVGINLFASENFTTTAQGTYITLSTTNHGSTTLTEKLRILHNGNVGINTISPSEKLDVNGNIKLSSATGVIKDASNNTAINVQKLGGGGRYIRQVEVQTYTSDLSVATSGNIVTFSNITGFKPGSLIKLTVYIPARGDGSANTWRGLYCEPAISYNNGTDYYSMGNTGYVAGNVMNTYTGIIGNSTHTYLINPETKQINGGTPVGYTSGSDFSVRFAFRFQAYSVAGVYPAINKDCSINSPTNYGTMTASTGTALAAAITNQNYFHIIVEELATLS